MFPICCAVYKEELPIESYSLRGILRPFFFCKTPVAHRSCKPIPVFPVVCSSSMFQPCCPFESQIQLLPTTSACPSPFLPVRQPFSAVHIGKIGIPSAVCCSRTKNPFILETILLREMLQDCSIFWKFGRLYNFNFKFLCKTAMRSALFLAIQEIF
mgnify:CR=1 FL=1